MCRGDVEHSWTSRMWIVCFPPLRQNISAIEVVDIANWVIICYLPPIKGTRKLQTGDILKSSAILRPKFFTVATSMESPSRMRLKPHHWNQLTSQYFNYFTSSDPHHDMLGGGCQVRVVIENMMGRMENLRTLISGFLGLVILVRWALVTMFLSWTTQTGCRIHRTYVSLIGSGEGRHTTHPLKCVLLLSTSQTDWKQSSDVLSDISFDILSDISSDISSDILWHICWHSFWHIFRYSFWHLSDISFDILSDISKPKPNIHSHSFTRKNRSANSIFTSHHAAKVISMTTLCL